MIDRPPADSATAARVLGITAAIGIMVAAIVVLGQRISDDDDASLRPVGVAIPHASGPIPAEADVFRTSPDDAATSTGAERRGQAHPRNMRIYRATRAYPGAPPRVPHGLTAEELRGGGCNSCHERGGYVVRFSSYAPITPHPELTQCMQCHLPDDALAPMPLPGRGPNATCLQCHVPDAPAPTFVALGWVPADWPETDQRALPGSPPWIPHDLHLRGNCLACHMAPGGVEEIRTSHPERADCRQCHLPAPGVAEGYSRPIDGAGPAMGGFP